MKFAPKRRLMAAWLIALSFATIIIGGSGSARGADGELDNDARYEAYSSKVFMDAGTAPDYLLFGALAVLGVSVLFKDAKRTHKKS